MRRVESHPSEGGKVDIGSCSSLLPPPRQASPSRPGPGSPLEDAGGGGDDIHLLHGKHNLVEEKSGALRLTFAPLLRWRWHHLRTVERHKEGVYQPGRPLQAQDCAPPSPLQQVQEQGMPGEEGEVGEM